MTAYAEKRKHKRAEVNIHADWGLTRDCPDRGRVVSVGGCFIRTEEEIPPGTLVFVHLWLPTGGPLKGQVRYRLDGFGVGIEFTGAGPETVDLLANMWSFTQRPEANDLWAGGRPGPVMVVS